VRVTVVELITRALQEIRVLGADAQLDASDADLALRYFQSMVDLFQIDGFLTYAERRDDYAFIPNQRVYYVGPTGPDWIGPVPTQIVSGSIIVAGDATATEQYLTEFSPDQWARIPTKLFTADYPSVFFYQPQTDEIGQFLVWPVPSTHATFILRTAAPLQTPLTLTTVLVFLPGYYEAWMLNLARRLVRPFAANEAPTLAEAANRALGAVKRMNDPGPPEQRSDPALLKSMPSTGMLIAASASGNPPVWGQIIGDHTSQADLQAALNAKVDLTGRYDDPAWVTALAASKVRGALSVDQGGVGVTVYKAGDILVAADPAHLVALSAGPAGQVLTSQGVGAEPAWAPAAGVPWGALWGPITNQPDLMAQLALKASLDSPPLTGLPTAPTAARGTNTDQIATTAFVLANTTGGGGGGSAPPSGTGYAHVTNGVFDPAVASIPESDVTNLVAHLALKAPLASPVLTGTPTAPTAGPGTNTTQIATTAFVLANLPTSVLAHASTHRAGGTDPLAVTTLAGYPGGTATFLRADGSFAAPSTLAHHTTHEPGGADALANSVWLNVHNFFTAAQDMPSLGINGPGSSLIFFDASSAVNQKAWRFKQENSDGILRIETLTDDLLTLQSTPLSLNRNGDATFTGNVLAAKTNAELRLTSTDQPANGRVWQILNTSGLLVFRSSDDALNQQAAVYIDRAGHLNAPNGLGTTPINAIQEWFPIIGGDISETGQTYLYQQGRYIKTGKQVTIWAYTQFSNKGTINGNLVIKNFPFPVGNPGGTNPPPFTAGTVSYYTNLYTPQDITGLSCRGIPTQSYAEIFKFLSAANNPVKMTGGDLNNTTQFIISMTYFID